MAASSQNEQKKVTVVISSPTPQRPPAIPARAIGAPVIPKRRRRPTKEERMAESPRHRIKQIRERQQMMEEGPMPRASRDPLKMAPDHWWMSFNTLDEHFAWSIVRRQVQTQLLKFEFLACPVAFGMAAARMNDLLTAFCRPIVHLERREHNRLVRKRFTRHFHQLLKGKASDAGLDSSDAVNEYDDPSPRLMLLGPADRIGALSAMGRRKTRNITTTPLQTMYRAMLSESYMGLTKSIDLTFFGIQWSSVPVFGPREYQLRLRLIAAMRKARDPLRARPPTQIFIVHDVVWAQRARIRLSIGDDVYERWTSRVNLGYRLAMYDRFSPAGMLTFPSDYADPMVYFDKMLSPRHTMWLTPPPGFDGEEEGASNSKPREEETADGEKTPARARRARNLRRFRTVELVPNENASTTSLHGSATLLAVPLLIRSPSLRRSRSRSEEDKLDDKSSHPVLPRSRSTSALLERVDTPDTPDSPSKQPIDAIFPGGAEDTPGRSFVRGRRPPKLRVFKSKMLTPNVGYPSGTPESSGSPSPSDSEARGREKKRLGRLGKRLKARVPRSRSASAVLMPSALSPFDQRSFSESRFMSERSFSEPSYADLLFEPSRVSSAFDSIIEGTDFFSSAENMRGPVRNLPPF